MPVFRGKKPPQADCVLGQLVLEYRLYHSAPRPGAAPKEGDVSQMKKLTAAVLFGSVSSEYEVSLRSAVSVLTHIPREKYDVIMLGITKDGRWYHYEGGLEAILADAGRVERISEGLMDQYTAVAGCGPAYVYQFIEALADGGVMAGLPRAQAQIYAAQTVLGAAAMVLETGKHPGQLKDEVCSPGGSTIVGVAALEENGFRSAAIQAVMAAFAKNKELGK